MLLRVDPTGGARVYSDLISDATRASNSPSKANAGIVPGRVTDSAAARIANSAAAPERVPGTQAYRERSHEGVARAGRVDDVHRGCRQVLDRPAGLCQEAARAAGGHDHGDRRVQAGQRRRERGRRLVDAGQDGCLVLVGNEHVGQREQRRIERHGGGRVEHGAGAGLAGEGEGRQGARWRRLELAQHHRRVGERPGRRGDRSAIELRAERDAADDRGHTTRRKQDDPDVGRPGRAQHEPGVDAVAGERGEPAVAALVVPEQGEHARRRAEPGRRDGLVRGLAAVLGLLEAVAEHRLALSRHRVDLHEQATDVSADDGDRPRRTLGQRIPSASGGGEVAEARSATTWTSG